MPNYGTLMSWDTLLANKTPVLPFGEQQIYAYLQARIDVQNAQVQEALRGLVDETVEYLVPAYGQTVGTMDMVEEGENGTPMSQKIGFDTQNMGFPLRRYGILLQWDQDYLENATVAEIAMQTDEALRADLNNLWVQLRRTIFKSTNYSFIDKLGNRTTIPVKAFVNADSMAIPDGPNGVTFNGATHTHFLATASLTASDVSALVNTVLEHWNSGQIYIYINQAQAAAIQGFTSNFTPYQNTRLVYPQTAGPFVRGGSLDLMDPYNREIGLWDGHAIVVVKPWMPASYMFAFNAGQVKPLAMRRHPQRPSTFRLIYEYVQFPLHARRWRREFGFGVKNRINGAVLYTGGGAYVVPTILT